jgi:hypothetical protein
MFADQGLQLHYLIVVAKLALPKNCHFLEEQGSAATSFIVVAKFTLLKIVIFSRARLRGYSYIFLQTKIYNYTILS